MQPLGPSSFGPFRPFQASRVSSGLICSLAPKAKQIFFKRDDLLRLEPPTKQNHSSSFLSGNKARKFLNLYSKLPSTSIITSSADNSQTTFPRLIQSYGGSQSNAMLSLARIASWNNNTRFVYYSKVLPSFLAKEPHGNLKAALDCGMQLVQLDSAAFHELVRKQSSLARVTRPENQQNNNDSLWVPQGGTVQDAQIGGSLLATELLEFIEGQATRHCRRSRWKVIFASGTGVTALATARALVSLQSSESKARIKVEVVAIACVGNAQSLKDQMITAARDRCSNRRRLDRLRRALCSYHY